MGLGDVQRFPMFKLSVMVCLHSEVRCVRLKWWMGTGETFSVVWCLECYSLHQIGGKKLCSCLSVSPSWPLIYPIYLAAMENNGLHFEVHTLTIRLSDSPVLCLLYYNVIVTLVGQPCVRFTLYGWLHAISLFRVLCSSFFPCLFSFFLYKNWELTVIMLLLKGLYNH